MVVTVEAGAGAVEPREASAVTARAAARRLPSMAVGQMDTGRRDRARRGTGGGAPTLKVMGIAGGLAVRVRMVPPWEVRFLTVRA